MTRGRPITIRLDEDRDFDVMGLYTNDVGKRAIVLDLTIEQAMELHDLLADKLDLAHA